MYYGKVPQFEQYLTDTFTSNATTYAAGYPLTYSPGLAQAVEVIVAGATQRPNIDYALAGQLMIFSPAIPDGLSIYVRYLGIAGTPVTVADQSITPIKSTETLLVKALTGGTIAMSGAEATAYNIYEFTGVLTSNSIVQFPANMKRFQVNNKTTGAFTLTVSTVAGAGVAVTQGTTMVLHCNGTDVINSDTSKANRNGDAAQVMNVAPASLATHAVPASQARIKNDIRNGQFRVTQRGTVFGTNVGTAGVTNASPNVTGAGTSWLSTVRAGNVFQVAGVYYIVSSVTSNTALVLTTNYTGATNASIAYTISPDSGAYDLDGWRCGNGTTAALSVARVAGSSVGKFSRQVTVTLADTSIAATDLINDQHLVEGYRVVKYVGNTFTIAFRAKVPVSGIHCVSLRNSGNDKSYVHEINFPIANVWQDCSFSIIGGLPTAGTWDYTTGVGLSIYFNHACGSTFQTTPDTWQTGLYLGTTNQVNDCATVGNVWALEDVRMCLGTYCPPDDQTYEEDLVECHRYYQPLSHVGGASSSAGSVQYVIPTFMRALPVVTNLPTGSGSGNISAWTGSAFTSIGISANTTTASGTSGPLLLSTTATGATAGYPASIYITGTMSAEL